MEITKEQALELPEFFTVYRTTNLISGEYYIGRHKMKSTNYSLDTYLGSSKELLNDIKELGSHNFSREILFYYDDYEEHKSKEKELLDVAFSSGDPIYNKSNCSEGGWEFCNTEKARAKRSATMKSDGSKYTERFRTEEANAKRIRTMKSKGSSLLIKANLPENQAKRRKSLIDSNRTKASEHHPEYLKSYKLIDTNNQTHFIEGNIFNIVDQLKDHYGNFAYYRIYSLLNRTCSQGRLKGFKLINN